MEIHQILVVFQQVVQKLGIGSGLAVLAALGVIAVLLYLGKNAIIERAQVKEAERKKEELQRQERKETLDELKKLRENHFAHLQAALEQDAASRLAAMKQDTEMRLTVAQLQESTARILQELLNRHEIIRAELAAGFKEGAQAHAAHAIQLSKIEGELK